MAIETPSTLKPEEVAQIMVLQGIKKHRNRYESTFLKAVSELHMPKYMQPDMLSESLWQELCFRSEACSQKSCKAARQASRHQTRAS
jgi:hypothetical protein